MRRVEIGDNDWPYTSQDPDVLPVMPGRGLLRHGDLASTIRYLRPAENTHVQEKVNQINWYKGSAVSPSAVPQQTAGRI
jgi:hypothetical protein